MLCAHPKGWAHRVLPSTARGGDRSSGQALPLLPETMTRGDGSRKNDCELNAAKRLLPALREAFPQRRCIVLEDDLYSNAPHIKRLKLLGFNFIIVAKPGSHEFLFRKVNRRMMAGDTEEFEQQQGRYGIIRGYRFVNDVPLIGSHANMRVNFLDHWEIGTQGKVHHFSFLTDIELTRENVISVAKAGRARWKVENETFKTLKNLGYHFEHNYGHGKKHLASVFANLMFLIDQIQELCCSLFKAARQRCRSRTSLWEKIRGLFFEFYIEK
jgi:hypothetical protein